MEGEIFSLARKCTRIRLTESVIAAGFSCGNAEIDDFFHKEHLDYEREMLARTYVFISDDDPAKIVAAVSVSNSSISMTTVSSRARNRMQRGIPNVKRKRSYPALLIGRLGVDMQFKGKGIGSQVIDYLKHWFSSNGYDSICRYLVVDAVNEPHVLYFYGKNGFMPLHATEEEERAALDKKGDKLNSRVMYCDLKLWRQSRS